MSRENVEVVRRSLEAWNRTDWEQLQAIYAPDVIVVAPPEWPEAEGARGWKEWRLQIERLKESWEVERLDVDEIRALPDGRVFARFVWVAAEGQVVLRPASRSPASPPSRTVRSSGLSSSSTSMRLSQQPDSRSRRYRR
jgi:ketosteroid isomerase-like protein